MSAGGVEERKMNQTGFAGLRVLSLESRRAEEMAKLISNNGGQPVLAPSIREVPLEANTRALEFASLLLEGQLDMVIFLTGVGTRALTRVIETVYSREQLVSALSRVTVVARGPKPAAALREMEVPISLLVPEPNTWRELLQALDEHAARQPAEQGQAMGKPGPLTLPGFRVALQEYGVSNPELVAGLEQRGALVMLVPVYQWALPEDTGPLRAAITALAQNEIDVAIFTSSAQVQHLLQIGGEMGMRDQVLRSFRQILVASIGPITSQELGEHGIVADLEPTRPKMGFLIKETADRSQDLLRAKRNRISA
jgi:uroporphyrinogen-III synthase